jgi:hypothetical protein
VVTGLILSQDDLPRIEAVGPDLLGDGGFLTGGEESVLAEGDADRRGQGKAAQVVGGDGASVHAVTLRVSS